MRASLLQVVPAAAPDYRAYAVAGTGRRPPYVKVAAEDDVVAVKLAHILAAFYPVELWHGRRFLGRFAPDGEGSSTVAEPGAIRLQ